MESHAYHIYSTITGEYLRTATRECIPYEVDTIAIGIELGGGYKHYYDKDLDLVVPMPYQPSRADIFDYDIKQWVDTRSLQDYKTIQWDAIKQSRTLAEYGGFTWDNSVFDSDAVSQNRITGAVQLAQISPGFNIEWTLADNTTRVLSAADMISVGTALGIHVGTHFAKGQALRTQIEAATTKEEVEGIIWQ